MRLREVEEAEKKQMMKERQQKLLEGQLVRNTGRTAASGAVNYLPPTFVLLEYPRAVSIAPAVE